MRLPDEDVKPGRAYNGSMNGKNGFANGNGSTKINTLPIDRVRLELVGMIREHDTLIVMGETGSGNLYILTFLIFCSLSCFILGNKLVDCEFAQNRLC